MPGFAMMTFAFANLVPALARMSVASPDLGLEVPIAIPAPPEVMATVATFTN